MDFAAPATKTSRGGMNSNDPSYWERWSAARGDLGDPFQRFILKSFIASYVRYARHLPDRTCQREVGRSVRRETDDLLLTLAQRAPDEPEKVLADVVGKDLADLKVLDLGCGEAFLGRWLVQMGARYLGVDREEKVLAAAAEKAAKLGLDTPVRPCNLVTDLDGLPNHLSALAEELWGTSGPDLVTITGVLDHIEDCRALMSRLAVWSQSVRKTLGAAPDFAIATLNPFFFRSLADLDKARRAAPNSQVDVYLAVGNCHSKAILRWPLEYERLFVDAGFHVLTSTSPDLGRLPPAIYAELESACGNRTGALAEQDRIHVGPFVLWLLRPRNVGRRQDKDALVDISGRSDVVGDIVRLLGELPNFPEVRRITFSEDEVIEHAGELGGGCYAVISGAVLRYTSSTPAQAFCDGDIFGEFEAGPNPTSDRYRDDLIAGQGGCELLYIPPGTLAKLLDLPQASVAKALFATLRARMSQYSWTWLDRATARGAIERDEQAQPAKKAKKGGVSDRTYGHLARALLFGLSRERMDQDDGAPAGMVAGRPDLQRFIQGEEGDAFNDAIDLLTGAGIIDLGQWSLNTKGSERWLSVLSHDLWGSIVSESFAAMVEARGAGGCDLNWMISKLKGSGSDGGSVPSILSPKNEGFSNAALELLKDPIWRRHHEEYGGAVVRWLASLAAIRDGIFVRKSMIFIRDENALRDIVRHNVGAEIVKSRFVDPHRTSEMSGARWLEYRDVTLRHALAPAKSGRLFRTTAEKVGVGLGLASKLADRYRVSEL